jgi:hypothetical protein
VSRYIDINQLLDQIGTSARSAGDPWTLSRTNRGTVRQDAFNPSVVADLGAPVQELTSEIQASQNIEHADTIASSPTSGQSQTSTGSGFLGGLLNAFPLASGIAKLFGFGDKPPAPALTPYELPPSISFEGAMSSATSGVTNLSYGANGLPRTSQNVTTSEVPAATSNATGDVAGQLSSLAGSNVATVPAEPQYGPAETIPAISTLANPASGDNSATGPAGSIARSDITTNGTVQYGLFNGSFGYPGNPAAVPDQQSNTSDLSAGGPYFAPGGTNNTDIAAQLSSLADSTFTPEPSGANSILSANLMPGSNGPALSQNSGIPFSSNADSQSGVVASPMSGGSSGAQGQSILVQVQAMDSQSFMDHSQDIAQAVRQAMLNLNSLNDVILDL